MSGIFAARSASQSRVTSPGVPTPMVSPKERSSQPNSSSCVAAAVTMAGSVGPSHGSAITIERYPRTRRCASFAFVITGR